MTDLQEKAMRLALERFEKMNHKDSIFAGEFSEEIEALRQALKQPEQVSVPEGWKLVPVEPTDAMLSVPVNIDLRECVTPGGVTGLDAVGLFNAWEAMIEAAPQPWDTSDMAYRPGGLSMEQEGIVPSDYSSQAGDYSSQAGDCLEQKPVAWWNPDESGLAFQKLRGDWQPLYTAPPKREWVGLTDEEYASAWAQSKGDVLNRLVPFARAIQAKLKEKNIAS